MWKTEQRCLTWLVTMGVIISRFPNWLVLLWFCSTIQMFPLGGKLTLDLESPVVGLNFCKECGTAEDFLRRQ